MGIKDYLLSIVLYGFLGYLFVLFIKNIHSFIFQLKHPILIGMPIYAVGFLIFSEITKRATDFNVKYTHPVKIVGMISTLSVVIITF